MTADYSQIEMRIMATLSEDAGLIEAFNSGEDLHTAVAVRAFGVPAEEVTPELRRRIKAMSYGLAYGLSAFGLSGQLKISVDEAQEQMEAYFARFGGVRDYLRRTVAQARTDGYTETVFGRRRYVPDLTSDNRQKREMAERAALNAPIQGSAADIIKVAMLDVQRRIEREGLRSRMLLQVHDELVCEVVAGEQDAMTAVLREEMAGAYPLAVPLEVSVGVGAELGRGGALSGVRYRICARRPPVVRVTLRASLVRRRRPSHTQGGFDMKRHHLRPHDLTTGVVIARHRWASSSGSSSSSPTSRSSPGRLLRVVGADPARADREHRDAAGVRLQGMADPA